MSLGVILALVMVQVLFASLAITGKFVLPFVPAFALVAFRLAGGAVVFDLMRRRQAPVVIPSRDRWHLIGLGLRGLAINQTLFLFGLRHSTAINATILGAPAGGLQGGMRGGGQPCRWRSIRRSGTSHITATTW